MELVIGGLIGAQVFNFWAIIYLLVFRQRIVQREVAEQEYFMKTKAQKIAAALDVGTCTYFEKKELRL